MHYITNETTQYHVPTFLQKKKNVLLKHMLRISLNIFRLIKKKKKIMLIQQIKILNK